MTTVVQLEHVGEPLLTKMYESSGAVRKELLGEEVQAYQSAKHEVPLKSWNGRIFDGVHRIDVAALDSEAASCVAIELKLGLSRMSNAAFTKRFLAGTSSSHAGKRVKGSMVSVLERLSDESANVPIYAEYEGRRCTLARQWVLVVRAQVANQWSRGERPALSSYCRLVVFEDLVEVFGGRQRFNQVVASLLAGDYYAEWVRA